MSDVPVLDRLGADLERALRDRGRRRRSWWRAHPVLTAALALIAIAVPAGATQVHWAALVGGETPIPPQVPRSLQLVLAGGAEHEAGAWQLVAYNARLGGADNPLGVCLYVVGRTDGVGRCTPRTADPDLSEISGGPPAIALRVSPRVARAELTLRGGHTLAVAPQAPGPGELRRRELPEKLRAVVVVTGDRFDAQLTGALVRDAAGRVLARTGRPAALAGGAPVLRSPVTLAEGP